MNPYIKYTLYAIALVVLYLVGRNIYLTTDVNTTQQNNVIMATTPQERKTSNQNLLKNEVSDTWQKTKDKTIKVWDKTKEETLNAGDAIADTSTEVWDKTKKAVNID